MEECVFNSHMLGILTKECDLGNSWNCKGAWQSNLQNKFNGHLLSKQTLPIYLLMKKHSTA